MKDEAVVALIRDITARLSAVADECGARAELTDRAKRSPSSASFNPLAAARLLLDQRRARRRHLPAELFHEPAWDMLLALYVAHGEGDVMNVKTLVASADAPATTAQRWIEHLAKLRLIERVTDPADRRRLEVSLSDAGRDAIEAYLRDISGD